MVRLRDHKTYSTKQRLHYFNSSMVRLREFFATPDSIADKYFNSSMVRLRERPPRRRQLAHNRFQFQYGAIESGKISVPTPCYTPISIPVWCD